MVVVGINSRNKTTPEINDAEKMENPKWTIKQKCVECFKGPRNFIKTLIMIICVAAVCQQISACVRKMIDIPVTTYTHFDFNKTLLYPSVTFCRDPPYKFGKMHDYDLYGHPFYVNAWENFNFANNSLDHLWEDITFNETDIFLAAGLDGLPKNIEISPTMGIAQGRCYTLIPKILSTETPSHRGYSVTLQHTQEDIDTTISRIPPGYHVYIHYTKEPFTEVTVYNGGLVDSLYVNVGETLKVKLKVDKYLMISDADNPCTTEVNYSTNACTTRYVWDLVGKAAGCSGPWMQSDLPRCSNYSSMKTLISTYLGLYQAHKCPECLRTCQTYLYNGYVADRQKQYTWDPHTSKLVNLRDYKADSSLQTQVFLYFNSMMVSVYEERYNYDGNMLLSDIGGSVGFLLGLSVIGLLDVCSKTWFIFVDPLMESKKKEEVDPSCDTADLKSKQECIEKWNLKTNN
ncbi:unnamed protein product [Arctia plantaginis]|uniref:Uncharacterized protein n=1 Tax=Arctia plantaginis TaxID=874455 RepID=A0A8S0ZTS5_ARCPL|nr:unnamed protein product [Arctia plantaginis]